MAAGKLLAVFEQDSGQTKNDAPRNSRFTTAKLVSINEGFPPLLAFCHNCPKSSCMTEALRSSSIEYRSLIEASCEASPVRNNRVDHQNTVRLHMPLVASGGRSSYSHRRMLLFSPASSISMSS
jgi:hypothetical protein